MGVKEGVYHWTWKGLEHDRQILNNMIGLWSPYIQIEEFSLNGVDRNPSHSVQVHYDFNQLIDETILEGEYSLKKESSYLKNDYVSGYPFYNNLKKVKRDDIGLELWLRILPVNSHKVGHYYMDKPNSSLVIYIDDYDPMTNEYILYVLNLWAGERAIKFGSSWNPKYEGVAHPWFNIYAAPLRKLREYPYDVTDWIGGKKPFFMNWDDNPLR